MDLECSGGKFIISQQQSLIEAIEKNNNNELKNLFHITLQKTKTYLFSYVVFLYKNGFYHFLLNKDFNENELGKQRAEIMLVTETIYKQFFSKVKQFGEKAQKIKQSKQYQIMSKQIKNLKLALTDTENILKSLFELMLLIVQEGIKNPQRINKALHIALGIQINKQINKSELKTMSFQEVASNYMKEAIEKIRVMMKVKNICCKAIFFKGQKIQISENQCQEFKRYTWPIKNPSIVTHISKTITGFMNLKGGIMYIGIMEQKDKSNTVVGITISQSEVNDIKKKFSGEYVKNILPRHKGFQVNQISHSNNEYIINDYVKLQFLPVANEKTLTNVHQRNEKNEILKSMYVIKVIVKIGHPKHLYHIVNPEKSIDFYRRNDRNVDKMQFPDAYTKIYENLDAFAEILSSLKLEVSKRALEMQAQRLNQQKQKTLLIKKEVIKQKLEKLNRPLFHINCQYSMDIEDLLLPQDEKQNSSESDDD